jgi:hypothetical protein
MAVERTLRRQTVKTLERRIRALERGLRDIGPCLQPSIGAIINAGEPAPADVVPYSNCGGSHVLAVEEVVVGEGSVC